MGRIDKLKSKGYTLITSERRQHFFMDLSKVTKFEYLKSDNMFAISPEQVKKNKDEIREVLNKFKHYIYHDGIEAIN